MADERCVGRSGACCHSGGVQVQGSAIPRPLVPDTQSHDGVYLSSALELSALCWEKLPCGIKPYDLIVSVVHRLSSSRASNMAARLLAKP